MAQRDFHGVPDVTEEEIEAYIAYLASHGVCIDPESPIPDWDEVLDGWPIDVKSPGPGINRRIYSSKEEYFLQALVSNGVVCEALVKEEATKVEKIHRGDYRFIFNFPAHETLMFKFMDHELGHKLKTSPLVYGGEDLRSTLPSVMREMEGLGSQGWTAFCCDSSTHDRSVSTALLRIIISIRDRLSRYSLPADMVEMMLHPRFSCRVTKEDSFGVEPIEVSPHSGMWMSGHPGTTLYNTLTLNFLTWLFAHRKSLRFKARGLGDNMDVAFAQRVTPGEFAEFFLLFGLKLKIKPFTKPEEWDSMGASFVRTPQGYQPHWNLLKSIVGLSLANPHASHYDVATRAAQISQMNYFHPEFEKFRIWFDTYVNRHLSASERAEVKALRAASLSKFWVPETLGFLREMATVEADERSLDQTLKSVGISSDGAKFIKMVTDPFHDTQLDIVGMPDEECGKSIVFDIQKEITLTRPAAAAGAWDCHISWLGAQGVGNAADYLWTLWLPNAAGYPGTVLKQNNVVAGTPLIPQDPFVVCSVPTGFDTFSQIPVGPKYDSLNLTQYVDTTQGRVRVLGGAFEVHNTTAELFKSGSVNLYRQNNTVTDHYLPYVNTAGTDFTKQFVRQPRGPPTTAATAKLLGGPTWEAEKGAYVVLDVDHMYNPPTEGEVMPLAFKSIPPNSAFDANGVFGYCSQDQGAIQGAYTGAAISNQARRTYLFPGSNCGAYFTGLNAESTLVLTVRVFVEVFPYPYASTAALAHPSPKTDYAALELASRMRKEMLAGVPVGMNAKGGFFKMVTGAAKAVSRTMPTVLNVMRAVPMTAPLAGPAGVAWHAAESLTKAVAKQAKEDKAKRKAKKKQVAVATAPLLRKK